MSRVADIAGALGITDTGAIGKAEQDVASIVAFFKEEGPIVGTDITEPLAEQECDCVAEKAPKQVALTAACKKEFLDTFLGKGVAAMEFFAVGARMRALRSVPNEDISAKHFDFDWADKMYGKSLPGGFLFAVSFLALARHTMEISPACDVTSSHVAEFTGSRGSGGLIGGSGSFETGDKTGDENYTAPEMMGTDLLQGLFARLATVSNRSRTFVAPDALTSSVTLSEAALPAVPSSLDAGSMGSYLAQIMNFIVAPHNKPLGAVSAKKHTDLGLPALATSLHASNLIRPGTGPQAVFPAAGEKKTDGSGSLIEGTAWFALRDTHAPPKGALLRGTVNPGAAAAAAPAPAPAAAPAHAPGGDHDRLTTEAAFGLNVKPPQSTSSNEFMPRV